MINPLLLIDFYKAGHVSQYPEDVTQVWSNWTPRSSRATDSFPQSSQFVTVYDAVEELK